MVPTGTVPHDISIPENSRAQDGTGPFEVIRRSLRNDGLFREGEPDAWRVARRPFQLASSEARFLEQLGDHLLAFSRSLNRLYLESVKGQQPAWIHKYFDQGKPEALVSFARMNRFKNVLPDIIRPDIIPTETGMIITELDSVPGGIGLTGSLTQAYHRLGEDVLGGPDGLSDGFASSLLERAKDPSPAIAIVVSEESESYRPEMQWLTKQLNNQGLSIACVTPQDISFRDHGLCLPDLFGDQPLSVVYRFFELFDLPNIPKFELLMYAAKKGLTVVTPPYKPWLEEKLAFALVHHPMVEQYWEANLPDETFQLLKRLIPHTWILDPSPIPPMGVIPGLVFGTRAVSDWRQLDMATQKERHYVVKPSGFSELAWGSRGVSIGHDLSQADWAQTLKTGLESFSKTPYILQEFHKGRLHQVEYYDQDHEKWTMMEGRVRLSPYYFVRGDRAKLSGVLATVCPKDKKIIHGMLDAVMMPCRTERDM
ncbi:MAG: hypothetical protein MRJ96_06580 [Nitrospirales bacterium]|nr:hypothetical protein [Nitrospira sp.]MDR4501099.1 hypothetical protein [Nitrospirales bacterium]